jgi:hypothetical protein
VNGNIYAGVRVFKKKKSVLELSVTAENKDSTVILGEFSKETILWDASDKFILLGDPKTRELKILNHRSLSNN